MKVMVDILPLHLFSSRLKSRCSLRGMTTRTKEKKDTIVNNVHNQSTSSNEKLLQINKVFYGNKYNEFKQMTINTKTSWKHIISSFLII